MDHPGASWSNRRDNRSRSAISVPMTLLFRAEVAAAGTDSNRESLSPRSSCGSRFLNRARCCMVESLIILASGTGHYEVG